MIGILLSNLGTPDASTPRAVKRYLSAFLSDPFVVDLPRWLWLPILHGYILRVRPKRSAKLYESIWTERGSPLSVHTKELAECLQKRLNRDNAQDFLVSVGMRYGNPTLQSALDVLQAANCQHIVVLPLYPQYAKATTGSTIAEIKRLAGKALENKFAYIDTYATCPNYINAIAMSIETHWKHHPRGEKLLLSFHGLPDKTRKQGDPYYEQCLLTAEALAKRLQLNKTQWQVVFQSRVGRAKWLQPYTDDTLRALPAKGIKSVDIICPGFAVDCLETLQEIQLENRDIFVEAGGLEYQYIPCLNASQVHVDMLVALLRRYI